MDSGDAVELAPLPALLAAHGGRAAGRHRAVWAFDARLAQVARSTSEAMIGRMRLAWWNDVIDDVAGAKGRGEPVVDALRATGAIAAPGLVAMIDGWEVLVAEPEIDAQALRDYAAGRGGGLFRALAGESNIPDWLDAAGRIWALWDLAGHVGDAALARAAIGEAEALVPRLRGVRWPRGWKPMRIAATIAAQDVVAGRGAPAGMPRAMALRLLRISLVGR